MVTKIIKIGNSKGIRIPRIILDQIGLVEEVELEVKDKQLVIRPGKRPRENWDEAFRSMAENSDDQLLDAESLATQSRWDEEEWEW